MASPIELPKLPFVAGQKPQIERESLPFSTVPLAAGTEAAAIAASEFEAYLNRKNILKLSRHRPSFFDPAAEILRKSVYKPIRLKGGD